MADLVQVPTFYSRFGLVPVFEKCFFVLKNEKNIENTFGFKFFFFFVLKNIKNIGNTKNMLSMFGFCSRQQGKQGVRLVPSFLLFRKTLSSEKKLKLENNNSFRRTAKWCFPCFQKLFLRTVFNDTNQTVMADLVQVPTFLLL